MSKINFKKVLIGVSIIIFFIIFINVLFFAVIFIFSDGAYGVYIRYFSVGIIKYDNLSYWQSEAVNAHEYGHYVWYEVLNNSLRDEFINISLKYKFDNTTNCYWGHDDLEREDFADTYRNYRLNPTKLFSCKDKLIFMNKVNEVEYVFNYG